MSIVESSAQFLQTVSPVFPKKVHKLLVFGYKALSLQRIQSVNSNARSTVANTKTAESKAYRLGCSDLLRRAFPKLVTRLNLVKAGDIIAVDFSDFGIVQVLMFAKQTHTGRALPVWFAVLPYGWTKETSQNSFVIQALDEFMAVVGCPVGFVFDRGFACPTITGYLAHQKIPFYQRIKGDKKVLGRKGGRKVREFTAGRHAVWVYGHRMNLVVTPEPEVSLRTSGKAKEPWFIVTNNLEASAEAVTEIYYHRFEIEEVFKDAKHLFGLEYIQFKKPERLTTVLWFVMLGMWLHLYLEQTIRVSREVVQKTKHSFAQGRTHYWIEKIRLELQAQALAAITL
jgi:DDE family transposase